MRDLLRNSLRSIVYPGLDIHLRDRATLARFWKKGTRDVLDAGSGNGYFSWLAYRTGARVIGLSFDDRQVEKAQSLLINYRKADAEKLHFEHYNLYNLSQEKRSFDEIICFEVLEHIRRDDIVAREFYRILKPGGYLHLCCPYKLHPRHQIEVLDEEERGGHVRSGYVEEDYRRLLEPLGFRIDRVVGLGSHSVYLADAFMRRIRRTIGDWAALPFLPLVQAIISYTRHEPAVPFSLYVRAVKPEIEAY